MKKGIIFSMISQFILICIGLYLLLEGKTAFGIFNMVANAFLFIVNMNNLKRLKLNNKL